MIDCVCSRETDGRDEAEHKKQVKRSDQITHAQGLWRRGARCMCAGDNLSLSLVTKEVFAFVSGE